MGKTIFKKIEQNFGFWMLLFSVIGFLVPDLFSWGNSITDKLLMFSFFLGCLRIDFEEAVHLKSNWGKLILFTFLNLVVLPVLLYFITPFLNVETRTGLFLIMAACGGMLTPLIASFVGLNVLWAVVYVVISSSLIPFVLPLLVKLMFGINMEISGLDMILFLAKIVFPPALLAYVFRKYFSGLSDRFMRYSGTIGSINMSFFIAIVIAHNHAFLSEHLFQWDTIPLLLMMTFVFVIRYLTGYVMPAASKKERWSNALLFGVMNNGLIILFANNYFSEQVMFVTLLSEVPWILAQPTFSKVYQYFNKLSN
ncbi:bile acid:sodium symporter family protein [Saccharicrinis sp. FJH54]|uniref:bile acid:sodium symporter family protein n=1 Tax=Saccharicrinis sp. FJH54 TaxID=3344665 RepID=UPI0035D44492